MEERIKQRLVGAVVLVSLVVIFVPMLLENEPVIERGIKASNIPPPPPDLEQFRSGVLPAPLQRPESPPGPGRIAGPAEPSPAMVTAMDEPEPEPASVSPAPAEPATALKPTPAAAVARPPAASTSGPVSPGVSGAPAPRPRVGVSAWVVQLASFARRDNADSLAERLRQAHHEAFVEQVEIGNAVWFRVRVGPELDRGRAEEMLSAVRATLGAGAEGAQVVRYP